MGHGLRRAFVRLRDIGVAGQEPETVRRLRTLNVVALSADVITVSYCLFYLVYDAALFHREIVLMLIMTPAYPTVLLLTRTGRVERAMWLLIVLAMGHLAAVNWLLGPKAGTLSYVLASIFITTLFTREDDRVTIWPVGISVCGIFVLVTFGGRAGTVAALPPDTLRLFFLVSVAGAVVLAGGIALFFRWLIARAEAELQAEKARGERLLRAILPDPVAEQLKKDESRSVAERCESATVLIADIVGFTARSAETEPDLLVAELNRVFSRADELAAKHGIERIKTLGDGYLAVCGLPDPAPDHAARMAAFALDLRLAAGELAETVWPGLAFRIVMHSGPVVAGVIGRTKFAYDVWGDTVNTAARMEEVCEPGEILLTETAKGALPAGFTFGPHKRVSLRDKGTVTVYPLTGTAPAQNSRATAPAPQAASSS
jgi:class 3 adenylate cyclase